MFADREEAGRRLATALLRFRDRRPVVLALPRGGVPVGFEVAKALSAPLDLVLVRKIGAPFQPELAVGAVVDGDQAQIVLNEKATLSGIDESYVREEAARQLTEIDRRRLLYLGHRMRVPVADRTAILVDDGIATGATMRAAVQGVRRLKPATLVVAVPVAPPETVDALRKDVDEIVCLETPTPFWAIGSFYADFRQLTDEDVIDLLDKAASWADTRREPAQPSDRSA